MTIRTILLVNPPYPDEDRYSRGLVRISTVFPPLGILYIASYLEKHNYAVKILDAQLQHLTISEAVLACKNIKPDVIGITCTTGNFNRVACFSEKVKENIGALIVLGGPHITINPTGALNHHSVDFVVLGEGEITMLDLLDTINACGDLSKVMGLGYKKNGNIIINASRPLIKNLSTLPWPARHLVPINKYYAAPSQYKQLPTTTIVASRGCPYRCTFCSSSNIWQHSYRVREVRDVIAEIKHLMQTYNIKDIIFWDDLWGLNREWVYEFCDAIERERIDISWKCELRANIVSLDLLRKMRRAGCWAIFYGFESLDQEILDAIQKNISVEQIENAIMWTKQAGIAVKANFIIGLPKETPEKIRAMVCRLTELNPDIVKFNVLAPYPGTKLYNEIKGGQWGEMTEDLSKLTHYFATFRPWGYKSLDELNRVKRYAFRKYYLRLGYLLTVLRSIRSLRDIMRYVEGLRAVVSL